MFFAKEEVASNDFRQAMIGGSVQKVYYARVMGDFRDACDKPTEEDGELLAKCDRSVYCVSNVEARWDCAEAKKIPFEFKGQAKEASTKFKFIHFDEAAN